jgi:PqqD family protein of HPr-rel-A system
MALTLRRGVSTADTDYGIALLDEDSGEYYTLNPSAALVLRTLLGGATTDQAIEELARQYAVDGTTAARDVEALVGDLHAAGLVEPEREGRP